jgi:hypothetical protein
MFQTPKAVLATIAAPTAIIPPRPLLANRPGLPPLRGIDKIVNPNAITSIAIVTRGLTVTAPKHPHVTFPTTIPYALKPANAIHIKTVSNQVAVPPPPKSSHVAQTTSHPTPNSPIQRFPSAKSFENDPEVSS